jgi:hypothetical protein
MKGFKISELETIMTLTTPQWLKYFETLTVIDAVRYLSVVSSCIAPVMWLLLVNFPRNYKQKQLFYDIVTYMSSYRRGLDW